MAELYPADSDGTRTEGSALTDDSSGGSVDDQRPVEHESDQSEIGFEDLVESDRDGLPDAIFDPKSKIKY